MTLLAHSPHRRSPEAALSFRTVFDCHLDARTPTFDPLRRETVPLSRNLLAYLLGMSPESIYRWVRRGHHGLPFDVVVRAFPRLPRSMQDDLLSLFRRPPSTSEPAHLALTVDPMGLAFAFQRAGLVLAERAIAPCDDVGPVIAAANEVKHLADATLAAVLDARAGGAGRAPR